MNLPYTRALVTGSTGFIGKRLVSTLKVRGVDVREVSLPDGDITDTTYIQQLFNEFRPEVVFHLAAYGTFGNENNVQRMIDVNISGTHALLEAAAQSNCTSFVMAGSAKEYATSRTPISEEQQVEPWDTYAATKAAAGFFCKLAATKYTLPVTYLRLAPAYGPEDSKNRFVLVAIAAALSGTPFTLTAKSLVRNFTFIDDIVEAFLYASLRSSGGYEVCNIAHSEVSSFEDVLLAIEKITGKPITRIIPDTVPSADDSWVLDTRKAKSLLGFEATVGLREGIARTVEWYTA